MNTHTIRKRIRRLLVFFSLALVISGITAIPVKWELELLVKMKSLIPFELRTYLLKIKEKIDVASLSSPELFYGFDWLAFAHIIIGIYFIGAIKDPVRNLWIIEAGMIACVLIIPFAFICGEVRGIPVFWRLIDCSFGLFGLVPLYHARKLTLLLEEKEEMESSVTNVDTAKLFHLTKN